MPNIGWNPFAEFARMREEMRHLFPDNSLQPMQHQPYHAMLGPAVDVHETNNEVIVSADIPGVDPTELNVTVDDMQITISGEIERGADRTEEGYRIMERRMGRFSRTIPLPVEVKPDETWADYTRGVLEIRMNKATNGRTRSKRIQIQDKH
ncbi:MAG: Hsp20/alpha crystallin family protein [Firmicutes bacterium]|nr:Hsp20/alpha crystallin family protein [Bacillota bacterium]